MAELLIATIDTFTKAGRYVPRGTPVSADEVDYEEGKSLNLTKAPGGLEEVGAVEMSSIAPTGPNPTAPQQIAPGTFQTPEGYADRGMKVVGEVTVPQEQRLVQIVDAEDNTQGEVDEILADASREDQSGATMNNDDDDLVAGTVADVKASIAEADAAELDRLQAAEEDRERPRKGVIDAIEARRAEL